MVRALAALAVVTLALTLAVGAAADTAIDDFSGRWQGKVLREAGDGGTTGLNPRELVVHMRVDDDVVELAWAAISTADAQDAQLRFDQVQAAFEPTDYPGVFTAQKIESPLLGKTRIGNPIEGKPFVWARHAGATFTIYTLQIGADGEYTLDQYSLTLIEGGLALDYVKLLAGDRLVILGLLERTEG
jgi:hypothetical protein